MGEKKRMLLGPGELVRPIRSSNAHRPKGLLGDRWPTRLRCIGRDAGLDGFPISRPDELSQARHAIRRGPTTLATTVVHVQLLDVLLGR